MNRNQNTQNNRASLVSHENPASQKKKKKKRKDTKKGSRGYSFQHKNLRQ